MSLAESRNTHSRGGLSERPTTSAVWIGWSAGMFLLVFSSCQAKCRDTSQSSQRETLSDTDRPDGTVEPSGPGQGSNALDDETDPRTPETTPPDKSVEVGTGSDHIEGGREIRRDRSDEASVLWEHDRVLRNGRQLRAGYFVRIGDVLVGAEPGSLDEPVELESERIDPEQFLNFPPDMYEGARYRSFHQLYARRNSEAGYLDSGNDQSFWLGLPIPDDFDGERVVAVRYYHGDLVSDADTDSWGGFLGGNEYYDPRYDLYLIRVNSLGVRTYPTRIGLVDVDSSNTEVADVLNDRIPRQFGWR